ncbi:unnamed protein product, partial [Strongylus vulgaris]
MAMLGGERDTSTPVINLGRKVVGQANYAFANGLMTSIAEKSNVPMQVIHWGPWRDTVGQANYAFANGLMTSIAEKSNLPMQVIHWGPWRDTGLLQTEHNAKVYEQLKARGWNLLESRQALDVLGMDRKSVVVFDGDFEQIVKSQGHMQKFLDKIVEQKEKSIMKEEIDAPLVKQPQLADNRPSLESIIIEDFVSTFTAHMLNLRGPAVGVYSACSTALLAIAQACNSLRLSNVDLAIAGGISLVFPDQTRYVFQEGLVLSKTGTCRPFDKDADGTVRGSSVGCVVLKRLNQAIKDNDHIEAVIRSYGMSNDGLHKASFMAPNCEGQKDIPFKVNTKVTDLQANSMAAVSSFGIGGTNVHLILDQPPPRTIKQKHAETVHILPIS